MNQSSSLPNEKKGIQTMCLTERPVPVKTSKYALKVALMTFIVGLLILSTLFVFKGKASSSSPSVSASTNIDSSISTIKAAGDPSIITGNYTCEILNKKDSYCPDDIINWKLSAVNPIFSDPTEGNTFMNCQIRGPPNNSTSTRPSGPRGFIDNCNPKIEGQNLQSFLAAGGTGTFKVPSTNYIGFSQSIDLYFYFEKNGAISSNFLTNAFCPAFIVNDCSSATTSTSTSTSTSTRTSSSSGTTSTATVLTTVSTSTTRSTSTASVASSSGSEKYYTSLTILLASISFFVYF